MPQVKKPKKVGFTERLASPKPSKPSMCLRWSPTGRIFNLCGKLIRSSDSECYPNMFMFLGTVRFRNDHVAAILGFGDLQWGNILITMVYFIKGLGHNLFSVGQFCDSNLEVAFKRNTCFVRNLEGVDLLKGNSTTNLYTINLSDMAYASPICLMARATSTMSWLWHQRLSYLNFDTINDLAKNDLVIGLLKFKYHKEHLFPSCDQGKCKRASHPPKPVPNSKALYYPKNDREDIGKLGAKGDIDFFIGYSATFCSYRVYDQRTKKIMETMNVTFDELSAMAFEQSSLIPELQTDTAPTPTNSSSQATSIPRTSQNVDELETKQQQHVQHQPAIIADNVLNAMFDDNLFVNPFVAPSTSAAGSSSSQYVDPSNMHKFYQPYPHEYQWTKDHPLEQVIGERSRSVLTRNQLRTYGDMCMYALTVSTMELKNVNEAMTDPVWIESMQEDLI
ncbi:retrovirus-related pol polyprotein from transposon TNT 1-94 [Tanacetum coccineum]